MMRMHHTLFNHSPIKGHLGCFQCLVITNKAAMNNDVQTSVWTEVFISLGQTYRSTIAGSYVEPFFFQNICDRAL